MALSLAYAALFLVTLQSVLALHEDVRDLCSNAGGATFCIPKVTILGLPKCATSAIAVYLREHPELKLLHGVKEACPGGQSFDVRSRTKTATGVVNRRHSGMAIGRYEPSHTCMHTSGNHVIPTGGFSSEAPGGAPVGLC